MTHAINGIREWARRIKHDLAALYLAARHPDVPWHAKVLAGIVVAYALSPIDLIPDFIPVLGYLDDLLLVPLGLWLAIRLVPPAVMEDCRKRAAAMGNAPANRAAAVVIIVLWIALAAWLAAWWFEKN